MSQPGPEVRNADGHLNPALLAAYGQGNVDRAEMAGIEHHLKECPSCCESVGEAPEDALLALLRDRGREVVGRPSAGADSGATLGYEIPSSFATVAGSNPTVRTASESFAVAPTEPGLPLAEIPTGLADHPRYLVQSLLGQGGMGRVYLARHRVLERLVALKVIRPDVVDPALIERFRREARAAASLSHPNIVAAFDAEQVGETHLLVMEYIEGIDLAQWVARHGPLPVADACDYARQVADGLQHALERGMVHRDIKPQNLMRTPSGRVKILDFGLARFASELQARGGTTAEGAILGSADYIAPEQVHDSRTADIRSDLYALGCTLYYFLVGRPPFAGGTLMQKLKAHALDTPPSPAQARPDLPPALVELIARLMAKDPADRPQTPAEAARLLAPFAEGSVAAEPAPQAGRGGRRRRWAVTAAGLGGLAAAAILLGTVIRLRTPDGILVIDVDDPSVNVQVDGNHVEIRAGENVLHYHAGPHHILATGKGVGFQEDVTLESGGKRLVRVHFEPNRRPMMMMGAGAHVGTPNILKPAATMSNAADGLAAAAIPAAERVVGQPEELVAVYGTNQRRHWNDVTGLVASPDRRLVATASLDRSVRLWDAETMAERGWLRGFGDWVGPMAFTPDGRRLVVGGGHGDPTIRVWDVASGREVLKLTGHALAVTGLAVTPDGRKVVSTSQDSSARVWDLETGKPLQHWTQVHWAWVVALSPDGAIAAVGSDGPIRRWKVDTGEELPPLPSNGERVGMRGLAYSRDGRVIATGANDQTLRLFDAESLKELRRHPMPGEVFDLKFSPDGRRLLARAGHDVLVVDAAGGPEVSRFAHSADVEAVEFSPDGRSVASGGGDRTLRIWDAETGRERRTGGGAIQTITGLAFGPDGVRIIGGSRDNTVRQWDVETGRELNPISGPVEEALSVAITPDGRRLLGPAVEAAADPTAADAPFASVLQAWDVGGNPGPRRLLGHRHLISHVAASSDSRRALTIASDATAKVWDLDAGAESQTLPIHGSGAYMTAEFSPDGRSAILDDMDAAQLRDLASGRELRRLEGGGNLGSVAFTADGRAALVGGAERPLKLWNLETGEARTIAEAAGALRGLAISRDGRHAYGGYEDRSVRCWEDFRGPSSRPRAFPTWHPDKVLAVALSPDGKVLASADVGGRVLVWDALKETKLREMVLPGQVAALAFFPDGRHLATANGNGSFWVLRLAEAGMPPLVTP